jgi:hypothetical protein
MNYLKSDHLIVLKKHLPVRLFRTVFLLLFLCAFLSCSEQANLDPVRSSMHGPTGKTRDFLFKPGKKIYLGRGTEYPMIIEMIQNGIFITNLGQTVYDLVLIIEKKIYVFGIVEHGMRTAYLPLSSKIKEPEVTLTYKTKPYISIDNRIIHTYGYKGGLMSISGQGQDFGYVKNEVMIKFDEQISDSERYRIFREHNLFLLGKNTEIGFQAARFYDSRSPEEVIFQLKSEPMVEFSAVNELVTACYFPDDPVWDGSNNYHVWDMRRIAADYAWDIYSDGVLNGSGDATVNKIILAIIDSGIYMHEDFNFELKNPDNSIHMDKILADKQKNFVNPGEFAVDGYGHGTCVAGIAGAMGNNGFGMSGVCWNPHFLPIKCLDQYGRGTVESIINSVTYISEIADLYPDYKVIANLSLGARITNQNTLQLLKTAVEQANAKPNVLLIAAAGNNGTEIADSVYPAALDEFISVGASSCLTDSGYCREVSASECPYTWGTNYGSTVDVCAPGSSLIYVTNYPDNRMFGSPACPPYHEMSCDDDYCDRFGGTSAAAPHVTGLAALLWSKHPAWTKQQVKDKIMSTADPMCLPMHKVGKLGSGRINCYRALTE